MTGKDRDPETSFIHQYVKYTQEQESPLSFHMWSALTVLGVALGRKCFIDRGFYTIYPNLFTVLVAGSALCRKSTAINLAVPLLEGIPGTYVISGKITPEKLTREIAEAQVINVETKEIASPNVLVFSSELSVFLTKQSYGEPIIHLLTDLFDCPKYREFKTKNRGSDILHNVFIAILAAATPDGVARGIPESALQEGFASRIMFPYEPSTDRSNAFPELSEKDKYYQVLCRKTLTEIAKLSGPFIFAPEAREWYKAWYNDIHKKSQPRDRRLAGFHGRKHDHLSRLGMLFAGSFGEKEILIGDLEAAKTAVEDLEERSLGAFQEIGATMQSQHYGRFKQYLRAYKRLQYSLLLKLMYPCTSKEFKELLETALMSGFCFRDKENPSTLIWNPKEEH